MKLMKINKILLGILAGTSIFAVAACDKFLDTNPDNRTEIDTAEKAIKLVASAYSTHDYICVATLSSDNLDDYSIQYTKTTRFRDEIWEWKDGVESNNESPENIWGSNYEAVSAANHAIEAMETVLDWEQNESLRQAMGEALICRAFAHFINANIFCMAYTSQHADKDLGIPYATEPEKEFNPKYERGTLAETYDMIKADIEKGLPLIGDDNLDVPKYHFNRQAAYAFATRFYLYHEEWAKAVECANKCLGSDPSSVLRDYDYFGTMPTTANLRAQQYVSSNEPANLLLMTAYSNHYAIWLNYTTQTRFNHGNYLATTETIKATQIFGAGTEPYEGKDKPHTFSGSFDRVMFYRVPYLFQYTNAVAGTGYSRTIYPAFTTDECLLNRAEAKIYLGDYEGAADDLNIFIHNFTNCEENFTPEQIKAFYDGVNYAEWNSGTVKKRFNSTLDTGEEGSIKESMLQLVVNLRRLENMGFGLRWFDIKRYGITIYRRAMNMAGSPDHFTDVMIARDPRQAVQIPIKVRNAGLQANPRNE